VLLPILKLLGTDVKDVRFWSRRNDCGVDIYTKIYFDYGKATATGKVGLGAKSEGELIITGTRGYIKVPAPWWLTKKIEVHFEDPNATEYFEYPFEKDGLRYEVKACLECIKGEKTVLEMGLEESIWIAEIMERFCICGENTP